MIGRLQGAPLPSPEELGTIATINAQELIAEPALDFGKAHSHVSAFVGLYALVDVQTWNRLTPAARAASDAVAFSSRAYLKRMKGEHVHSDPDYLDVHHMYRHIEDAGDAEQRRIQSVIASGVKPEGAGWFQDLDFPSESPAQAEAQRRTLYPDIRYSADGIREVLDQFGKNFGPFIVGLSEVAVINRPDAFVKSAVVGHAYACLDAASVRIPTTAE